MISLKKLFLVVLIVVISACFRADIYALDEEEVNYPYTIYDAYSGEVVGQYLYDYDAQYAYSVNLNNYNNLVLVEDEKIIDMEYGLVRIDGNIEYRSLSYNINRHLDGDYGTDAIYLRNRLGKVFFYISGETGYVDREEVELIPYEELMSSLSFYVVKDGKIHHLINSTLDNPYHNVQLSLGEKPEELTEGQYYSYDGHYFYDDFYSMADDYKADKRINAINDNPYYNYYQYLSFHSLSNYSGNDINSYIEDILHINKRITSYTDKSRDGANDLVNASELYKMGDEFMVAQQRYGTNAAMLLNMAIVESSYGKNLNAYKNHSLYRGLAFDNDENRDGGGYRDIAESIDYFSHYYVSTTFDNYLKPGFAGTNFGTQVSGFTSSYSFDPYYGEKLAAQYYDFDSKMGYKDVDSEKIAIINAKSLIIYANEECSDYHYSLGNLHDYSMIILDEYENVYKVKLTQSLNLGLDYSEGYILKNSVDRIIGKGHNNAKTYDVVFDYDGGLVKQEGKTALEIKEGLVPSSGIPVKDGYIFVGFDKEILPASENITYTALYKPYEDIVLKPGSEVVIKNGIADISKVKLTIIYDEFHKEDIEANSDMVFVDGNKATVSYCGKTFDLTVVSKSGDSTKALDLLEKFGDDPTSLNVDEVEYILKNISSSSHVLTIDEIRMLDGYLLSISKDNYHIHQNDYDIQVSGLASSIAKLDKHLFKNCYYIKASKPSSVDEYHIEAFIKEYGFDKVDSLKIDLRSNYSKSIVTGPLVYSLKVDGDMNSYYSVYHFDGRDVEKCYTKWSNGRVYFVSDKTGTFAVLRKDSLDVYDLQDEAENIGELNNGFDNHHFIRGVLAFVALYLILVINVVVYYLVIGKDEKEWKDCRRLLLPVDTVLEEKLKNS